MPDDDWRTHDPRFQEPQLSRHLALAGKVELTDDDLAMIAGA